MGVAALVLLWLAWSVFCFTMGMFFIRDSNDDAGEKVGCMMFKIVGVLLALAAVFGGVWYFWFR